MSENSTAVFHDPHTLMGAVGSLLASLQTRLAVLEAKHDEDVLKQSRAIDVLRLDHEAVIKRIDNLADGIESLRTGQQKGAVSVDQLSAQLKTTLGKVSIVERTLALSQEAANNTRTQVNQNQNTLEKLTQTTDKHAQLLRQHKDEISSAVSKIAILEERTTTGEAEVQRARAEMESVSAFSAQNKAELEQRRTEIMQLQSTATATTASVHQQAGQISVLEEKEGELQGRLNQFDKRIANVGTDTAAVQHSLDRVSNTVEAHGKQLRALEEGVATATETAESNAQDISFLQVFETATTEKINDLLTLKPVVLRHSEDITTLQFHSKQHDARAVVLEDRIDTHQQDMDISKVFRAIHAKRSVKMKEDLATAQKALSEVLQRLSGNEKRASSLEQNLASMEEKTEQLNHTISEAHDRCGGLETALATHAEGMQLLDNSIADVNQRMDSFRSDVEEQFIKEDERLTKMVVANIPRDPVTGLPFIVGKSGAKKATLSQQDGNQNMGVDIRGNVVALPPVDGAHPYASPKHSARPVSPNAAADSKLPPARRRRKIGYLSKGVNMKETAQTNRQGQSAGNLPHSLAHPNPAESALNKLPSTSPPPPPHDSSCSANSTRENVPYTPTPTPPIQPNHTPTPRSSSRRGESREKITEIPEAAAAESEGSGEQKAGDSITVVEDGGREEGKEGRGKGSAHPSVSDLVDVALVTHC